MSPNVGFQDRNSAGEQLAQAINAQIDQVRERGVSASPIVYALPRGGLPVAAPVAQKLGCPLDIIVAKKIVQPEDPELAIGAVTVDGQVVWSNRLPLPKDHPQLQQALLQAQEKAIAQFDRFAAYRPKITPEGAIAILIDDGIATGMTISVATSALQLQKAAQVWIGTPVAPLGSMKFLRRICDRIIVLETPQQFFCVSRFYIEFPQVEMEDACSLLQQVNRG